MPEGQRTYVPAAGHDWLLPLYDPFVKWLGGEASHRQLIEQAQFQPGQRVLEIGCGTGSLTTLVKSLHPGVDVVGLDPDPKALARARRKADKQSLSVGFDRGFSDALPYPEGSLDRVLSAFMFHHLSREVKRQSLREILRVLKPEGSLHLVDFGRGHEPRAGFFAHLLHGGGGVLDLPGSAMIALMQEAGLADPAELAHRRMSVGNVVFYGASRPRP